ncbi:MAG: DUF1795 domain-containing protein [Ignavibacteria bacterium]|nr:DUF1795 domain-containing protein [Ignavibacteria bacterium]
MKKQILLFLLLVSSSAFSQQVFESKVNTFTITFPDDWTIDKSKTIPEVSAIKGDSYSMNLAVKKNAIFEGKTLEDFGLESLKQIILNEFEKRLKDFVLVDYGNTEVNTNPACYFKYSFTKDSVKLIAKQYLMIKNGKMYIVTVACKEEDYKSGERLLEEIVNSFTFTS